MYTTFRTMKADPSRLPEAIGLAQWIVGMLNERHGGDFTIATPLGTGDPSSISVSSPWETLGAYQTARESMAADPEMQSAIRMAGDLVSDAEDTIAQVLSPPGDRQAFVETNQVMMHMPAAFAAIEFALEIAEFASEKLDRPIGLMNAFTGNRAGLMFVAFGESLEDLAASDAALEADADYQAFFKRSEGLMVPGTLQRGLWQIHG